MGTEMVRFSERSFIARRNFWNWFGIKCRILSVTGTLLYFVKLKAFKLKEDITVFEDENQTSPLLTIKARQIIDFAAAYDVVDVSSGEKVGAYKRKGLKSIFKDEWTILDANDEPIGSIKEDSALLALLRRFLSGLIAQSYTVEVGGQVIGTFKGTWNPFIVKYSVNFDDGSESLLDPRLAVAGSVLLMTIEGKQA